MCKNSTGFSVYFYEFVYVSQKRKQFFFWYFHFSWGVYLTAFLYRCLIIAWVGVAHSNFIASPLFLPCAFWVSIFWHFYPKLISYTGKNSRELFIFRWLSKAAILWKPVHFLVFRFSSYFEPLATSCSLSIAVDHTHTQNICFCSLDFKLCDRVERKWVNTCIVK